MGAGAGPASRAARVEASDARALRRSWARLIKRIYDDVRTEVGQIIVATVNTDRIRNLLDPDRVELGKLIRKE